MFCFTLATRIVLVNLLFSFVLLVFTGNREQWYTNLSLNPLILLALIPITMFHYFLVLPIFTEFHCLLLANIKNLFNFLGELAYTIGKSFESKICSTIGQISELFGKYRESKALFSIARERKIHTN